MDAILNWLWQGAVVAAAWFVMLLALRRARANVRYIVCWAAALLVIALPAVPALQSTEIPAAGFPAAQGAAMVSLPDAWWTSAIVMLAAWTLWSGVLFVRFASAIVAVRRARARARSRAFPSHVESALPHWRRIRSEGRRASLVLSDAVTTAAVLGWGAPMIAVAPSLVTRLDADELDRVLIHEWAHVQRRDDLVNILQIAVRMIAGWHPALSCIDRRLHVEREIACDEITIALTGSPKSYAECLVKLAGIRGAPGAITTQPAVLTSSGLRARVVRIVSPHPSIAPAWSRSIAAAIVMTLCFMSAGLGGLKLVEAAELALPLVSARMLPMLDRIAPVAAPKAAMDVRPTPEPSAPAPRPGLEPEPDATSNVPSLVVSMPVTDAAVVPGHVVDTHIPGAQDAAQRPANVTADTSQSPWSAAAAGGVAIGKTSKQAGVATAGFFTRFARKVAGSFH